VMSAAFPANAITYDLVPVGNQGNTADVTGYGSVPYDYRIGKYLVTISQYTAFLNSVAKTDTYSLYNGVVGSWGNIAGISRTGVSGSYSYSVMNNAGDSSNRPITYVSWFDAARFANWMANGQPVGSPSSTTTEDGAYRLNGITSGTVVAKNQVNPNTRSLPAFSIPTENEWYKAAYYSPNFGGAGVPGYYVYGTQSNTAPGNEVGSKPNQANHNNGVFSVTQVSTYSASQNYLTDVGAFTASQSFYGGYDLGGNVNQWNDLDGSPGSSRGVRGGVWDYDVSGMRSTHRSVISPADEGYYNGVRLAATFSQSVIINVDTSLSRRTQSQLGRTLLTGATPVIKAGYGTLVLDQPNTLTGSTTISQGSIVISHTSAIGTSTVVPLAGGTLSLSSHLQAIVGGLKPSAGGVVDVGNGLLTVADGLSALNLYASLSVGRGSGVWDGSSGIKSSSAFSSGGTRTVGWLDNGDGSVTFGYAAAGDANLDWTIDIIDIANFLGSGKFNSGLTATWAEGDFNYDGFADITDIADFISSGLFNAGPYNTPAGTIAAVPEPSTYAMAVAGIACGGYSLFRRRKQA
jgi:sulfatase modifying factor 1